MPVTAYTADVVVPVSSEPVRDGAVLVEAGRVVAVVRSLDVPSDARQVRLGPVVTPGLVNAHAHLEYGPMFADLATGGRTFPDWIGELTRRRVALTADDWHEQAGASADALLRTGTTAVADIVTDGAGLAPVAERCLAGISYVEAVGADEARWADVVRRRVTGVLDGAPSGRRVGLSPHTLYTLGTSVFRAVVDLARERGLRLHPHLAETLDEEEFVLAGTGRLADAVRRLGWAFELVGAGSGITPAAHLDAIGGLGCDVHVAHGVHCGSADRSLLRERGTSVALCTRSNAVLHAGEAPVAAYFEEGNAVAIGTDSLASTPDLDLLAEARALRDLARRQGYGGADLDRRVVEAATVGGAQAMGLDDVGHLSKGARADLAAFDVATNGDPYSALVDHGGGSCRATVLAGEQVVAVTGRQP